MNGQIPWWQSRTIWFGLIQAAIGLAVAFGLFSNEQGSAMAGYADQILGLVMTALAAAQVQGRATSTKEIKPEILPPANPTEPTGTA